MSISVIGFTAISGIIIGCWAQVKTIWNKISGLIIIKVELYDGASQAFTRFLIEEWNPIDAGTKLIVGSSEYVRPERTNLVVGLRRMPTSCLWCRGKQIIFVSGSDYDRKFMFIRGMFRYDDLVLESLDKYNNEYKSNTDRYDVVHYYGERAPAIGAEECCDEKSPEPCAGDKFTSYPIKWTRDELGYKSNSENPFDTLYYDVDIDNIIKEIELWIENGDWFKERMIPWKRGYLLYGKPGTGKTVFVRSIAQKLKIPICVVDLSTMTNDQLIQKWNRICSRSPCVVLFEDLDSVFHGRKNVACEGNMERGITFDCLLNVIDGVKSSDGILTFVTTNDISKLDPALGNPYNGDNMSTRPGRIDKILELGNIGYDNKIKMSNRILGCFDRSLWENIIPFDNDDSPAQFQERCSRLAMELWEKMNIEK